MHEVNITFLGTGSAFSKRNGNNSAVVSITKVCSEPVTKRLMIDCGRTTPDDLVNAGFKWTDIDAIFITHLHGDHVYGLEEAGFMGRYVHKQKPHLIFPHKKVKTDLWDRVLRGTMADGDLPRKMTFDDYFTYEIVNNTEQYFLFNDLMISVYSTQHVPNKKSYGIIIGEYDYIIYTSDSLFDKGLIEMAVKDGAQAIFHDCQFTDYDGKVHASLDELETLDEEYRKKIAIMHYGDDLADYYTRIRDAQLSIVSRGVSYSFKIL